jgi:methyl-accepting chemotaxis protein
LQGLKTAIKEVIDTTLDLNESMTQIQLVTQQNNDDAKELIQSYSELAKSLGTTTADIASASVEWLFIRSL